jgi:hypothetical protein
MKPINLFVTHHSFETVLSKEMTRQLLSYCIKSCIGALFSIHIVDKNNKKNV